MKATSSQLNQSSRNRNTVNGNAEDNHHDDIIINQGQLKVAISPKKKKGLSIPANGDDEGEEITDIVIDIPALLDLVKAQGEEIEGLKEAVNQLDLKVNKQSQLIEGIKNIMRGQLLSWESFWKENDEQGVEIPVSPTSGQTSIPGCCGHERPCSGNPWVSPVKDDLSKSPRKRGRPPKKCFNPTKMPKIEPSSQKSDDDGGIENTVKDAVDHVVEEEPWMKSGSSSRIREDSANGDGDDGETNGANDDDVGSKSNNELKDTSFIRYHKKQAVKLKSKLKKAILIQMSEEHRCEYCGKLYKTKGTLKTHIQSVHEDFRYNCPHCPGTFAQFVNYEGHIKRHKKKGGPPLAKCKVCGMELRGKRGVRVHMAAVHKHPATGSSSREVTKTSGVGSGGDDPFKCQLCEKTFKKREILMYHLNKSHGIKGRKAKVIVEKNAAAEEELQKILAEVGMFTEEEDGGDDYKKGC